MAKMAVSMKNYQRTIKNLRNQVKRLKASNNKKTDELNAYRKIDKAHKENLEKVLDGIGHFPTQFIKLILKKANRVIWKTQDRSIMELCLTLYFKSPSCYETLRNSKLAPLPSRNTLRKQFEHVFNSGQGLCPNIMAMLKEKAKALSFADTHVAISFNGMSLKLSLKYDKNKDIVLGFAETKHPSNTTYNPDIVNQGVAIMIGT